MKIIPPIDQLYKLNAEIIHSGSHLDKVITVVGGQVIAYWLSYFKQSIQEPDKKMDDARSSDMDFMMSLHSARDINLVWQSILREDKDHPPPQLAKSILVNEKGEVKVDENGDYFANADLYEESGDVEGNVVDVIDWPKGFDNKDFANKKLLLNTVPFEFVENFKIEPHENLRILTPVACLRSRLENAFGHLPCKSPMTEAKRIFILMEPLELFFQYLSLEGDFRVIKSQLDYLLHVIMSRAAKKCAIDFGFEFPIFYRDIVESFVVNELYLEREFPRQLEKLDKYYSA